MTHLSNTFGLIMLSASFIAVGQRCEADEPSRSFTSAERERIDVGAMWSPREKRNKAVVQAYGSALEWLVARTPLPPEEELRRTLARDKEVLKKFRTSETPAVAKRLLEKLVAALPKRNLLKAYQFRLTVIEDVEQDAFTMGTGRIFVDHAFLKACLVDKMSGTDRLAFVIAHELGHVCREHLRRRFQHQWLEQELLQSTNRNTKAAIKGVGTMFEHVYTRDDDFQADLFAIHLCRNAGFDLEGCLDVLRREAVAKNATLLQPHPRKQGTPPVEPEIQRRTNGESLTLAGHPSAVHRLRRLRVELDGLVYGDMYGLFEFDQETNTLKRSVDKSIAKSDRVVVCVHGMESDLSVYRSLMKELAEQKKNDNLRILGFQYQHDESLSRSGMFLKREIKRVFKANTPADFVCHSAGGLVFRYYAEIEKGPFRRAFFQGTPHTGSDLAKLRPLIEAKQFLGDLGLGYDPALERAIRDGRGQVTFDLQPGSLFLRYLNRPGSKIDRERYVVYRGRAVKPAQALLLSSALSIARGAMKRSLAKQRPKKSMLAKLTRSAVDNLKLPAEVLRGDLAVTLESAALEGVKTVHTYPLKHRELPRHVDVIQHLVPQLLNKTQP